MIGPIINASAVLVGGIGGAALGPRIPERLKDRMPMTFGLASMAMGATMLVKVDKLPVMVIALLLGALVGELIYLEKGIGAAATKMNSFISRFLPKPKGLSEEEFLDKYVAIVVLFCASGTGIFGSLQEGMTGDSSILIAKSALDLLTGAIFATALGYAVAVIAVPQVIFFMALALGASAIQPLLTGATQGNFSAVGGAIMLATGFRICGIKSFPIANMLPALIFVVPLTPLWAHIF